MLSWLKITVGLILKKTDAVMYTIDEIKKIVSPIAKVHGVQSVSLFGSYARKQAHDKSDIDLLIDKGNIQTLYQLSSFRLDIEDALKLPVDLVTSDSNDHDFLTGIRKDEVLIYGEP